MLILGGGLAGVTAARTLQAAGMRDFLLLEAADRLGGRMLETKFYGILAFNINSQAIILNHYEDCLRILA